jgi:hypothetical protein
MIDLTKLDYEELQELKQQISKIESEKTRKYEITFSIEFFAKREDTDLDDIESFCDSFSDVIFSTYNLKDPIERITFISSKEV